MLHQEVNNSTLLATAEALEALFLGIDHERADVPVIVERAQTKVPHALLLKRHEVTYDLLNLRRVQNAFDDVFLDFCHSRKKQSL